MFDEITLTTDMPRSLTLSKLVLTVCGSGNLGEVPTVDNVMAGTREIHVEVQPGLVCLSDITTARMIFNSVVKHIGRIPGVIALPNLID